MSDVKEVAAKIIAFKLPSPMCSLFYYGFQKEPYSFKILIKNINEAQYLKKNSSDIFYSMKEWIPWMTVY